MASFWLKMLLLSVAIYTVGRITKLYKIEGFGTAFLSALVLALVNAVIRPIFIFLTFPITIITLGIFLFFVNGLMLLFVSKLVPRFKLEGCFTASVASLLITICTMLLEWLINV